MKKLLFVFSVVIFFSCHNEQKQTAQINSSVKYAKGFTIEEKEEGKLLTIKDAWRGETTNYQYFLYKDKVPGGYKNAVKVKVPVRTIACMSLTHIAFIQALGMENTVVAASGCNYSNNPDIINRLKTGLIKEVGSEQNINYEVLIEESPDIIMAYGINENSLKYIRKFKTTGITTVLNSEYMETHPLGKAEWIKFVAAFYGKEKLADSLFNEIEKEYIQLTALTKNTQNKPTVFVGMPWGGNWYVAGGASFQSQLFKDAGANYLWSDNNEKSSVIKSKEQVIEEAYEAEFWINQGSYNSVAAITDYDKRLKGFKSIEGNKLYNNSKRVNQYEGNDYWESGTVQPQVVLKDLIEIFHPDLIEHDLYYYQQLK